MSEKIEAYQHKDKRKNNPPVGLVTPETDGVEEKQSWAYDPHIDPALQFDSNANRAAVEKLIDEALESGDQATMQAALETLKQMQAPYLNWTGKAEKTSFEVDTVSLHVHERIDPATILQALRHNLEEKKAVGDFGEQADLFDSNVFASEPLREAVEFYKHEKGWANRMISGDSLLVMNSLLQKESMAGQVQMIYIDPPYGIKYGSNFQPFVNKRDVKDRSDEDLTQEPEMIKAFRDTWELGIHSYLTYLRDRLLLARELLADSGSVFVQISDENVHRVRDLLDDVFGINNFCGDIVFVKTTGLASKGLGDRFDYLIWYGKNAKKTKYRQIFLEKSKEAGTADNYSWLRFPSGHYRGITSAEKHNPSLIPDEARIYQPADISSQGNPRFPFTFGNVEYSTTWKTTNAGLVRLGKAGRFHIASNSIRYVRYLDDYPATPITKLWDDTATGSFTEDKIYVVQTGQKAIERCLLMTTDPGDLVLDITCGSGTTAFVAEKWGRRWITCDTSRVSVTLAKQRLMTAQFDYFPLKYPDEGIKAGFIYKTVPHVTLKSIANNPDIDSIYEKMHPAIEQALAELNVALKKTLPEWEVPFELPKSWTETAQAPFEAFHKARQAMQAKMDAAIAANADQEILYDQPKVDKNILRVTGPFTVEAVPFPSVLSLQDAQQPSQATTAVARSGATSRQQQWQDELLKAGIRGKGGQKIEFAEIETLSGTQYLHARGLHKDTGEAVVISFGPEHAPLEQRQVEFAIREAEKLRPAPKLIVFAAFNFDPEAAKDIDELNWPGVTLLKVQMNTDLLTEDLKKKRASNESFWLMGQPDVRLSKTADGLFQIEVLGFDYFDTQKSDIVSGGKNKIAMWLLDTDYDERALLPRQVFFPMAGAKDGWNKLSKSLKATLNEERLAAYHGTLSLPFAAGKNRKVAVKVIDDRGIESLKILPLA
ncbi:site-specific DNA-methyltransferase [Methylomonas koyamae]|uniref:site-specific DNA-methyltransferase n=1 Tax=Methylomonas koyamae TaxID=702114 RepID=UPI000BC2EE26|nr:site-specific DNA-methyltransferase [Methylomonas koyamae]ATG89122.1 DNA methylase [Methylomonas koyamae]